MSVCAAARPRRRDHMRASRHLIAYAIISVMIGGSSTVTAQVAPLPDPTPPVPQQNVYHLTLEDAKQRALATSKGLGLANLGIQEKREATAAARTDYLPKVLGSDLYFHFNSNLGEILTVRRGRFGILPVGTRTVAVRGVNQDANLLSLTLFQPITKLIAVNAAVKIARADEEIAQAQLAKGTRELLSGVAQAYYGLHAAQRIETALRLQANYAEQLSQSALSPEVRVAVIETRQA